MLPYNKNIILREIIVFVVIAGLCIALEYLIITTMDLNPIMTVKIQGLIGLIFIAYLIRSGSKIKRHLIPEHDSEPSGND